MRLTAALTACYFIFIPSAFCGSEHDAASLIGEASKVDVYRVARALPPSPALVTKATKTFSDTLSEKQLKKFKLTALAVLKRPDDDLRASCPFVPDLAFRLNGSSPHWWLVSRSCLGAKLVDENQDWRRVALVPMTETDIKDLTGLAGK